MRRANLPLPCMATTLCAPRGGVCSGGRPRTPRSAKTLESPTEIARSTLGLGRSVVLRALGSEPSKSERETDAPRCRPRTNARTSVKGQLNALRTNVTQSIVGGASARGRRRWPPRSGVPPAASPCGPAPAERGAARPTSPTERRARRALWHKCAPCVPDRRCALDFGDLGVDLTGQLGKPRGGARGPEVPSGDLAQEGLAQGRPDVRSGGRSNLRSGMGAPKFGASFEASRALKGRFRSTWGSTRILGSVRPHLDVPRANYGWVRRKLGSDRKAKMGIWAHVSAKLRPCAGRCEAFPTMRAGEAKRSTCS